MRRIAGRPPRRAARGLALAAVLALACVPRALDLDRPGLTYDEYYDLDDSLRFCRQGSALAPVSDGYLNGQAPFVAACAAYRVFGDGERVARGLTAVASVLAVGCAYLLARRFMPPPWALMASAWLALSPFFLSASRLAFSHGHLFAVPWLLLALREALAGRRRLTRARAPWLAGLAVGFAAGNDLLAMPWALTLVALAALRLGRRAPWPDHARFALRFSVAWLAGLCLASPMYAADPWAAARDVSARLAWWDAQQEHVWLGSEVAALPAAYYLVVLLVKVSPPLLALVALLPLARPFPVAARVLLPCLWPTALLVLKAWKSPFYLTPFLPLVCVLAAAALRALLRASAPARRRRWAWAGAGAATVAAAQLVVMVDAHPDHLMSGIRWSRRLYGDFAGPAVSHGQWVREALEHVRRDAGRADAVVAVPLGYAPRQVSHYAARFELTRVHSADELKRGVNPRSVEYVVVSHDVLAHAEGRRLNGALLRLAADSEQFAPLVTLRSAGFPMARIYKRIRPRPARTPGA